MKRILQKISDFFDDDLNFYASTIAAISIAMLIDRSPKLRPTCTEEMEELLTNNMEEQL